MEEAGVMLYFTMLAAILALTFSIAVAAAYAHMRGATFMEIREFDSGKVHLMQQRVRKPSTFHESVIPLAFALWLPWKRVVMLDQRAILTLSVRQLQFTIAHELGHLALGHCRRRFWLLACGYSLFIDDQESVQRHEDEADAYAERVTGYPRSILVGD